MAAALIWLVAIEAVGLAALPVAYVLFSRLSDRGAGLAKILGLALSTYGLVLLVRLRLLANGTGAALVVFGLLLAAGAALFLRRRSEMRTFWREKRGELLLSEAIFLLGFVVFLLLRAFNPEIAWGEKPMDFSILNILVRAKTYPTSDPWFAGAPLGYYVFGQQIVAFLTQLTLLSTRFTFNLAFALLGGTIAQGAFSLARGWAGTRRAGFAALLFTLFAGNLAGVREFFWTQAARGARHLDWHYFWATSRVIPDTINEYPLWSLIFADLHAHVLALPLFLLVVAAALQLARAHADPSSGFLGRLCAALLLGFAAAAQILTNAWDVPLLTGLLVLSAVVAAASEPRFSAAAVLRAVISLVVVPGAAVLLILPLWSRQGQAPGVGWNWEAPARGLDLLTHFGLFFFVALAVWATGLARRVLSGRPRLAGLAATALVGILLVVGFASTTVFATIGLLLFLLQFALWSHEPGERLASGFLASAFFLVLFSQRAFIYDRMNTYFKLYFMAWALFALATAVLAFRAPGKPGTFQSWPIALRVAFALLLAGCLFTAATAAYGGVFGPNNASRGGSRRSRVTLDGLDYLQHSRPAEYRAIIWLRRNVRGTPVVLEAQGESYREFSRVSMLTGLPTVLGWEHHVKQRGNPEAEVERRRAAIRRIYTSARTEDLEPLLSRYRVRYVYVGWVEQQSYSPSGLRKFDSGKELFELVYQNPETRIYRVVGSAGDDVIVPFREELPPTPPTQGDEPEEKPSIRAEAEPGATPFSGMREPRDAAVDGQGRVWITDFGHSRIRVFDSLGGFLGGWGGRGSGTHGLREPCGVAVAGEDLYIADTWNGRIQKFSLAGEWKASAAGGLYGPRGVAISPDGTVWVTDTGNKRIIVYRPDLEQVRVIGREGPGPLEFSEPVGIAVGPNGVVYVADSGNHRIQMIVPSGNFGGAIPVPGWKGGAEPHLEVAGDGVIYAADPQGNALLEFDSAGKLARRRIRDDGGTALSRPSGVALDRKNRILYVVNSGNDTVSKWKLPEPKKP